MIDSIQTKSGSREDKINDELDPDQVWTGFRKVPNMIKTNDRGHKKPRQSLDRV